MSSSFQGAQHSFALYVDDDKCIKMNKNSIDLKRHYDSGSSEEREAFPGTFLLAIERESGYFSIHDSKNKKKCFAVNPEWKGVDSKPGDDSKGRVDAGNDITIESYLNHGF